jgi:acyl-coenzyme A thioesterase PaaI-like protein
VFAVADSDLWLQALPHFHCFACDPDHPKGLRLGFDVAGPDRLRTQFTVSGEYVGAERFVHGGIIATVFDDLMKWCLLRFRPRPHITLQMEQRFRHPIFTDTPLIGEATIVEDLPNERTRLTATLVAAADPGTILAEGSAVFALTPPALLDLIPREQQTEFEALFATFTQASP